jgi:hypothetical protein
VPFTVSFSPLVSGTVSGSLSIVSNASTSTIGETVSGTGQSPQDKVSLSWSSSTSSVIGYNVYRGTTSGSPYAKINSFVDSVVTYADGSVQSGQTYYVTTSVASVEWKASIRMRLWSRSRKDGNNFDDGSVPTGDSKA